MKGDLPDIEGCRELLLSNVTDEENHDIALNFAAEAHRIPDRFEKEAERIKKLGWNLTVTLFSKLWFLRERLLRPPPNLPIPGRHWTANDLR